LTGKLSVLTSTAKNQGRLLRGDDDYGSALRRMQNDRLKDRWLQSVGNPLFEGIMPANQVDALPVQRIDNVLEMEATDADAGGNAIHSRVHALQGQFTAIAGLACDGFDLNAS
jgi:hypothetical protein